MDHVNEIKDGNVFGSHRVIEPAGALPQPAGKINNDTSVLWDNEILVDVEVLNIDSVSFTQIKKQAEGDVERIKQLILDIVDQRGKMQNPVTGSGGIFIGNVAKIGRKLKGIDLNVGDKIASLVSLSLTPLKIESIEEVRVDVDQVVIYGQAILFESGIYAKLPEDIPATLALAVLDVAGAPAQTARLVKQGDTVVVIGATGKSGVLCAYEAARRVGSHGRVIGIGFLPREIKQLKELGICESVQADATDALGCYEIIEKMTDGKLADVIINCVNVPETEMASILMCKDQGTIYFFSMATSFTKAALGAEGVGKDINMIIGNGYAKGHANLVLNIMRESSDIRKLYETIYC